MGPQEMIIAGSIDHLQSRGLLARLTGGSVPSNEVMGEAIIEQTGLGLASIR